jgi:hypothetical protein
MDPKHCLLVNFVSTDLLEIRSGHFLTERTAEPLEVGFGSQPSVLQPRGQLRPLSLHLTQPRFQTRHIHLHIQYT